MIKIGYARVSKDDQNLERQTMALTQAGCDRIYTEKISGADVENRPELKRLLKNLLPGETLVVQKLDRLGRSVKDLIKIIDDLGAREINFISLTESIDTTSATGKLMFQMIAIFAEFERNLIRERVIDGLNAARAQGKKLGSKHKIIGEVEILFRHEVESGSDITHLTKKFKMNRSTVYRNIDRLGLREIYSIKQTKQ